MPQKGTTNNSLGRPKGVPNKTTRKHREWLDGFFSSDRAKFRQDWKRLEPHERMILRKDLYAFVMPKMQSMEFEKLSDEQLDAIFQKMIKHNEDEQV